MKVKVNDSQWIKVKPHYEGEINKNKEVYCQQLNCWTDFIKCGNCIFNGIVILPLSQLEIKED